MNRLVGAMLAIMLVTPMVSQGCSGQSCSQDGDCSLGQACLYPIGSCSARGTCMTFPDPAGSDGCNGTAVQCGYSYPLCGCGVTVMGGCNYPSGYAGGPTNGDRDCVVPSLPSAGQGYDGGDDASTSTSQEGGEAGLPDGSGDADQ